MATHYGLYTHNVQQWLVFPWELEAYIVPVKGGSTRLDSVTYFVPYLSGDSLYHGHMRAAEKLKDRYYGVHRAYDPGNKLKAIIDYDQDSMWVFDRAGRLTERTKPHLWQGKVLQ